MKKKITIGLLLAAASSGAFAQQYYKAANEHAMYCGTAELASKALHANGDEIADLLKPDMTGPQCATLEPGETFTLARGNPSDDNVKQIKVFPSKILSAAFLAGPITPVAAPTQADITVNCAPGDAGPGGEVDRWVVSKDGTLKLKRYMITSRCVNGKLRSFTKPLN